MAYATTVQLAAWLDAYRAAWENRDPDAAARLFTADARYYETPYAEPFKGPDGVREYWARVTADQRDVRFTSEVVGIADGIGVATWNVHFTVASNGAAVQLNGVFLLQFGTSDSCKVLREWWHAR